MHAGPVVGYIRVSTEQQADQGVSLDAQRAKLEAYAQLYELDLVAVIIDAGVSAKTLDRPGLQQALGMLRKGQATALLVTKLDRLMRSIKDLSLLLERYFAKRYALMSVADQVDTSTAAGRLVVHVLMSVAQWEREAIGERTREAVQHKKTRGEKLGGDVPYGYRVGPTGTLLPDPQEQVMLGLIRQWRAARLSLRTITAELAAQGYLTRKRMPFHLSQVARLVKHMEAA